jgi:hypothetical protein
MAPSNDAQIAMEQGMMIAEVNMAIGAVDRILKMIKDGLEPLLATLAEQVIARGR